jgi:glycosyltransferase involved in cell wall biosynthesis
MWSVSVILCTYNRCSVLQKTLDSLAQISQPPSSAWELIIVDNNSRDSTRQVVETFVQSNHVNVQYLVENRRGKSYALNTAISHAKNEILAFTDDDVIFDRDWLERLLIGIERYNCLGVGGRIVPAWDSEPPSWFVSQGPYKMPAAIVYFDCGTEPNLLDTPPFGANMAFRRDAFEKYGLFRTDLGPGVGSQIRGEDTEFCLRLMQAGERIASPRTPRSNPVGVSASTSRCT